MASFNQLAICLCIATCLTLAASFRVKRQIRQGTFQCPQPNGTFAFPQDCSKFYQCGMGEATLMTCSTPLLYNSNQGICDWPAVVMANPGGCTPPITNQDHSLCANMPTDRDLQFGWAWTVAHPTVCNAFYTCGPAYLYAPCTFCPEDMYFDGKLGTCEPMYMNSPESFCQGNQFVAHKDKVFRQLDGTCWPYSNIPNPHQALADKLAAGGYPNNGNNNNNPWNPNGNNGNNNNNPWNPNGNNNNNPWRPGGGK